MKRETFKSIILVSLIVVSLVLSFIIWNFQPKYGTLQSKYVSEVEIGGIETTKRAVIKPKDIIFHKGQNHYGFHNALDAFDFYEAIYDWDFSDLTFESVLREDLVSEMIEIQFPLPIQTSFLQNLFSIDKADQLSNWSFEKMLIIPNKQLLTLNVYFMSEDEKHSFRVTVNNSEVYMDVMGLLNREHHLAKYVQLETEDHTFYLPEKGVNIPRRSLAIEYIEPPLLVNALFRNP